MPEKPRRMPQDLSREELVAIVEAIQRECWWEEGHMALYDEGDSVDRWNGEKEWDADQIENIAGILSAYALKPFGRYVILDVNGDYVAEEDSLVQAEFFADKFTGYHVVDASDMCEHELAKLRLKPLKTFRITNDPSKTIRLTQRRQTGEIEIQCCYDNEVVWGTAILPQQASDLSVLFMCAAMGLSLED